MKTNKKMICTNDDREDIILDYMCYICQESFTAWNRKVKDHCHLTGLYIIAACNTCNLSYKNSLNIMVGLHNMSNYDIRLIINYVVNEIPGNCSLIPNNLEK